jgi:hypothetical protein
LREQAHLAVEFSITEYGLGRLRTGHIGIPDHVRGAIRKGRSARTAGEVGPVLGDARLCAGSSGVKSGPEVRWGRAGRRKRSGGRPWPRSPAPPQGEAESVAADQASTRGQTAESVIARYARAVTRPGGMDIDWPRVRAAGEVIAGVTAIQGLRHRKWNMSILSASCWESSRRQRDFSRRNTAGRRDRLKTNERGPRDCAYPVCSLYVAAPGLAEMATSSARIPMRELDYSLTLSRRRRRSPCSLFHRSDRKSDR